MALEDRPISIPLLAMNQKAPPNAGPVGRIMRVDNGVTEKIDDSGRLTVAKRPALDALTQETRDPSTGALVGGNNGPQNPRLATSLGDQLVEIGDDDHPYVLSDSAWERHDRVVLTQRLGRNPVIATDVQILTPDGANVGNVFCYTYIQDISVMVVIQDKSGTVIREPFPLTNDAVNRNSIKVVSDGARFWVFFLTTATTLRASVYDTDGVALASGTVIDTLDTTSRQWDAHFQPSMGVCVAREVNASGDIRLTVLEYDGGIDVLSANNITVTLAPNEGGMGFMLNEDDDDCVYLAVAREAGDGGSQHIVAYRLNATTMEQYYEILDETDHGVANITGFQVPGTTDVWVTWSQLDLEGNRIIDYTMSVFTDTYGGLGPNDGGTPDAPITRGTASVASRAFRVGSRIVVVLNYSSILASPAQAPVAQPTYFLLDIAAQQVVGRFEYGRAAMDWVQTDWDHDGAPGIAGPYWYALPTAFVDADGVVHLPLGYRATSFTIQTIETLGTITDPISGQTFTATQAVNRFAGAVGLLDLSFGAPGQAVEYAGELLLPGPQATSFTGVEFTESNIALAPELPEATGSTGDGDLTGGQTYSIVVVYETVTTRGERIKSRTSVHLLVGLSSSQDTIALTGYNLRLTERSDVKISIYSTFVLASSGLMSTTHRKVTNDLDPLLNDPTDDTWNYTITASDSEIAVGEPLYTDGDPPPLDFDPAPPFHCGCVMDNRMLLAAYDGAVWFSFEKFEGMSLAWNGEVFRMVRATSDPVEDLVPMDRRLVIGCRASWWFAPAGRWPDAVNAGFIPTPELLPFTNGTTGHAVLMREGVAYISNTDGRPWMIGRDLTNRYFGDVVEDEIEAVTDVISAVATADQKIIFATAEKLLVFDTVTLTWYVWTLPEEAAKVWALRGQLIVAALTRNWQTNPEGDADNGAPIETTVELANINLDGVSGYQRIRRIIMKGRKYGRHNFQVHLSYDDSGINSEDFERDTADDPTDETFRHEFRPAKQKCLNLGVTFSDSFDFTRVLVRTEADNVVALTRTWTFENANFVAGDVGAELVIAGSVDNDGTYTIESVVDESTVVTVEAPTADETFDDAVTATLNSVYPSRGFILEALDLQVAVKRGLGKIDRRLRIAPD